MAANNDNSNSMQKTIGVGRSKTKEMKDVLPSTDDVSDDDYNKVDKAVSGFCDIDFASFASYAEWNSYFRKYENVLLIIDNYDQKSKSEENNVNVINFMGKVGFSYDKAMSIYTRWQLQQSFQLDEKINKQQINSLSVFSIFMTLLTFLLTNISKVVNNDSNYKTLLLTNLILLCVASVVFLFIGVFLGVIGKGDSKKVRCFKYILLFCLPFAILAAILAVAFCLKV